MSTSTQTQKERGATADLFVANSAALRIVADMISRAGRMLAQHLLERAYRRAAKKLMKLDDQMLRDIGLTRSEIEGSYRIAEMICRISQP